MTDSNDSSNITPFPPLLVERAGSLLTAFDQPGPTAYDKARGFEAHKLRELHESHGPAEEYLRNSFCDSFIKKALEDHSYEEARASIIEEYTTHILNYMDPAETTEVDELVSLIENSIDQEDNEAYFRQMLSNVSANEHTPLS